MIYNASNLLFLILVLSLDGTYMRGVKIYICTHLYCLYPGVYIYVRNASNVSKAKRPIVPPKAKEPPPKLAPGAQALLAQMHESKYSRHNKIAASAAKAVASASQRVK